jgi:hypothetical protein
MESTETTAAEQRPGRLLSLPRSSGGGAGSQTGGDSGDPSEKPVRPSTQAIRMSLTPRRVVEEREPELGAFFVLPPEPEDLAFALRVTATGGSPSSLIRAVAHGNSQTAAPIVANAGSTMPSTPGRVTRLRQIHDTAPLRATAVA